MTIVSLLDVLVNGLIEAEENFFNNLKDFHTLEKSVKAATESFAAGFLGEVLSSINRQICKCSWREGRYNIQRNDSRTIVSSVGDISFDCTYFKKLTEDGGYTYLLEEVIGLDKHERFTE